MWNKIIETEQKKEYFKNLMKYVEYEYDKEVVFPPKEEIYNAFSLTPFEKVKVIILGQDPYHDYNQAHGLAFSVKKEAKIPPSLRNIYKELNADLGIKIPSNGNLELWAKQGVLMLNTILTVRAHSPLSHKKVGWEVFTDKIIMELNKDNTPKVFVLWGNKAIKKKELLTNPNHLIIQSSHPSPLGARHSFFGSKPFSRINEFLEKNNRETIDFNLQD